MRIANILAAFGLIAATASPGWAADKPAAKASQPAKAVSTAVPRTRDNHPDFEDTLWSAPYQAMVEPLPGMGSDLVVSEEKAKALYARLLSMVRTNENFKIDGELDEIFANGPGLPLVRGERHTRLVVTPADGRLPITPATRREINTAYGKFDNPEDRPAGERCLDNGTMPPSTFLIGAPRQFIVTPDYAVVHVEYADEVIIAPFTDHHGPWQVHPQGGDSIARWDGDTLVIETINFPNWNRVRTPPNIIVSTEAKVTERYTRVSNKEIVYQFAVEDPKVYATPWTGEYSFYSIPGRTYASSCHEGNYSLPNILGAARESERLAAAKKP